MLEKDTVLISRQIHNYLENDEHQGLLSNSKLIIVAAKDSGSTLPWEGPGSLLRINGVLNWIQAKEGKGHLLSEGDNCHCPVACWRKSCKAVGHREQI